LRGTVEPDAAAHSRGEWRIRGATRAWLHPGCVRRAWRGARVAAVRARERSDQDLPPHPDESFSLFQAPVGDGVSRMGPGGIAEQLRTVRNYRTGPRHGGDVRAELLEPGLRHPDRLRRPRWRTDRLDRRPDGIPWSKRRPRPPRRAQPPRATVGTHRGDLRPLLRPSDDRRDPCRGARLRRLVPRSDRNP